MTVVVILLFLRGKKATMSTSPLLLVSLLLFFLPFQSHAIECFKGMTTPSGAINVTSITCASNYNKCIKCFIAADNSMNQGKPPYNMYTYQCGSEAFKNLIVGLGANDCWLCDGNRCNTGAMATTNTMTTAAARATIALFFYFLFSIMIH